MRTFLLLLLLVCFKLNYGQTNYYTFNTDSVFSEESIRSAYKTLSNRLPDDVLLKPIIYHRITRNDSIINYLNFVATRKDSTSLYDKLFENGQKKSDANLPENDSFKLTFQQDSLFLLLGKKLPEFSLKDLNGETFTSKQLAGKPALINYWSIYCGPCIEEIPDLNKLRDKYMGKMNFVAIAESACSEGELESFLQKRPFNFRMLTFGDKYKEELKIQAIPINIFIDENGIIKNIQKNYPMDDRSRNDENSINDNNYFVKIIEKMISKKQALTQYILQGGVQWFANCGFSFRSSVSFGQERSSKSAPTTCTKPLCLILNATQLNEPKISQ